MFVLHGLYAATTDSLAGAHSESLFSVHQLRRW